MNRDLAVMRYIGPAAEDTEAERCRLREVILGRGDGAGTFWHVEFKASPGFLGWCGLFPLEKSGFIEIGYRYTQPAWGKGIATEAARAALDHGFRILEVDPIAAVVDPDNRASQGVLEKIGLRRDGMAFHYGRDLQFYRLARSEYLAQG